MSVKALAQRLRKEHGVELRLTRQVDDEDPILSIDAIIVPENLRGKGKGSAAMKALVAWADKNNHILSLTPSADYGTKVTTLKQFYNRFGFVPNKGRNKDYRTRDSFIRYPERITMEDLVQELRDLVIEAKKKYQGLDLYYSKKDAERDGYPVFFSHVKSKKGSRGRTRFVVELEPLRWTRRIQETKEILEGTHAIGYKVMRKKGEYAVSGADSRQRFPLRKGSKIRMPGYGIYLTPHRQYALDYYSGLHDEEVLLKLKYKPSQIAFGNLQDREPEIAVPEAVLVDFEIVE
jgi:hypothetical protein